MSFQFIEVDYKCWKTKKKINNFFSCACLHMISDCMYDYKVIKRKGSVLSMIFNFFNVAYKDHTYIDRF